MRGAARDRSSPARGRWSAVAAVLPPWLRGAGLMPGAALAVHQLRYKLAFGPTASHELAVQGHAYLAGLAPWIVLLAGFSVGATLGLLAQRWANGAAARDDGGVSARLAGVRVWLVAALALVAIYCGQELLEGLLETGHPGGLAGVFGDGGWWAVPVAMLVAGLLALALRCAQAVERALADRRPWLWLRPRAARVLVRLCAAIRVRRWAPLARAAAGRAPPRALASLP
ncbi:MAG TPA: hypothetical protein VFV85_06890 [Conexibacter sp.]|nr:hypothetical protein [Conexibacter sp.]